MLKLNQETEIGIIGAGTMGSGIAQLAAACDHSVILFDTNQAIREQASVSIKKFLNRLEEKKRIEAGKAQEILNRIHFASRIDEVQDCGLVIEAIVENLSIKQSVFNQLEKIVLPTCIIATNTSSLSIASIAATCEKPERVLGAHFFNPAPLMPLVEIIPGLDTAQENVTAARSLIDDWGKTTVLAEDTPGFIVNRIARPFYGESIRILEEGVADVATIDWAMREIGGFRMGPFELMDFIGNDINYKVTMTVFEAFFYDPRYKPGFTQKRMVESKRLGRKSGIGYYDYRSDAPKAMPVKDQKLGEAVLMRVLVMLINEAVDALFLNIATREDIDLAMTKGVNYPKGLLKWADEIGLEKVLTQLMMIQEEYGEDRYRPSPLLKRMVRNKQNFY